MCNPRRIRVRATRQLAEAWDHEVHRRVILTRQVSGEARVREQLGRSVGGPTLAALTRVLARTRGWAEGDDGVFRHALDGGVISFDPSSRELEIIARVEARVVASGESAIVVRAQVDDLIEASGEGRYYDDEYGGVTADDARRAADRAAQAALDRAAEAARARERRRAETAHWSGVEEQARMRAQENLAATQRASESQLASQAADLLTEIGNAGRTVFHRALAEAYRDAILAYARTRRATGIQCSEGDDGALNIEFELEV
jgi:FtsH ternary system domain X2